MKLKCLMALAFSLANIVVHADQTQDPCVQARLEKVQSVPALSTDYMASGHADRVTSMCSLADALQAQYSNYDLKADRIKNADGSPFNSTQHLKSCVERENQITDDNNDLRFVDRVTQCIAGFKDSHMDVMTPVPIPYVTAGFTALQIDGKYYIATLNPEMMEYVAKSTLGSEFLQKAMFPGNEIVEIDGQSPAPLAQNLQSYISGSSEDFVGIMADRSLFFRNFDYPTKNVVELKIKDSAGQTYHFKLPWWGSVATRMGLPTHSRPDAATYFRKIGIPTTDRISIPQATKENPDWTRTLPKAIGYQVNEPMFADAYNPLVEYYSAESKGKDVALRVGEVASSAGAFCYMELMSFMNTKYVDKDGKEIAFEDAIGQFLGDCTAKKLNLVFDLRYNPGGHLELVGKLMSLLTKPDGVLPSNVMAYRTTADTGRLLASDDFEPEVPFENLAALANNPLDFFNAAVVTGQTETPIIPGLPAKPDEKYKGFPGKILTLVTPTCVSACDITSSILKKSGRSVFLGTHSNGTGAGFSASSTLNSDFTDANDQVQVKIPNFLFGVPDKVLDPEVGLPYDQYKDAYLLENRPTVADIQYSTKVEDLDPRSFGKGWREAVLKAVKDNF